MKFIKMFIQRIRANRSFAGNRALHYIFVLGPDLNLFPYLCISFLCCIYCFSSIAQNFPDPVKENLTLKTGVDLQNEDFRWSIAGNIQGTEPNILSELIFSNIKSAGFYANAEYKIWKYLSLHAGYTRLYTYKGTVTDFDYDGDNRTNPITQLYLQSNEGNMKKIHGAIMYDYQFDKFNIKAGVGYSSANDLFYLSDTTDPNLRSTYLAKWKGPSLSLRGNWQSSFGLNAGLGIQYNILKYNATANWDEQADFQHPVSFTHHANGRGPDYSLYLGYQVNKHLHFSIDGKYSNWRTGYGKDRLFLTDGTIPETRMNGAFRKSTGLSIGAGYTF